MGDLFQCWRYLFSRVGFRQVGQADTSLTDLSRDGLHPEHNSGNKQKKRDTQMDVSSMLALPIFPGRLQPSIVGRSELNFRVRDGNGWTLALISTNYLLYLHPENRTMYLMRWEKADCLQNFVGQALGLLVPVSCIHYCTSTSGLSTRSSFWALTP